MKRKMVIVTLISSCRQCPRHDIEEDGFLGYRITCPINGLSQQITDQKSAVAVKKKLKRWFSNCTMWEEE